MEFPWYSLSGNWITEDQTILIFMLFWSIIIYAIGFFLYYWAKYGNHFFLLYGSLFILRRLEPPFPLIFKVVSNHVTESDTQNMSI